MKYSKEKMSGINVAYIGGGSREWAWKLMIDLALEESLSGHVKLYDLSYEPAKDNADVGNKLSARNDVKGKWDYSVVNTLDEALKGADFVVISILPGTFTEMTSDVHTPEKYGIYQSVGDTVGPGGLMRALRTITIYVEFADAIKKYCPDAWVINYTNPMTICTRILYEAFPEIKAFGCCHEVFNTQDDLIAMLKDLRGIDAERNDIKVNVQGINHFTWFNRVSWKNIDLFPLYAELIKKYEKEGFWIPGDETWEESPFKSCSLVKFDLFKRYGIMGAAGDRHLAEFMPGKWYLKDPESVKSWKFRLTTIDFRIARNEKHAVYRKKVISDEEQLELKPSGEEGVRQIKALVGLGDFVTNVNIPNNGQMPGLPQGAVVETNAYFTYNNITPVYAGRMQDNVLNLVSRHVFNQETIIKAAVKKDKELAFSAFVNDPLVTIPINDARILFNEMLENTKNYLTGWKI
jgi:galacturan 1,4-alpha-galacturonidase